MLPLNCNDDILKQTNISFVLNHKQLVMCKYASN